MLHAHFPLFDDTKVPGKFSAAPFGDGHVRGGSGYLQPSGSGDERPFSSDQRTAGTINTHIINTTSIAKKKASLSIREPGRDGSPWFPPITVPQAGWNW